jgi:hypothetical protein
MLQISFVPSIISVDLPRSISDIHVLGLLSLQIAPRPDKRDLSHFS